ncbi:MAG: S46 family peptidase [Prevotella sp.]|nr:S46 family peptidase [Prevotella sp.]
MKKNLFKKGLLFLFSLLPLGASADEGMWTIYNLPNQVFETMQGYGFQLSYDELYKGDTSLKAAVVNFSGYCSGVVVSPDGLVFTNHHCGFEAIRSHSTVEHDYMLNGFYAKDFSEELPNKDMFVSFMIDQKDVTDQINGVGFYNMSDERKQEFIDSLQQAYTDEARKTDPSYHVEIDAFFEGNKWYATTYQKFDDVRLVFAVPKSMGKFGGETDNWMWPRQTCDYSVFRIYAKDNKPAAYSKDNTPYHPKRYAQVSLQGYKDGDYAMTIGYPGSTSRYLSSYGIKERRDASNAPRAQVRGVKQDVMTKHMRADEAVRIKYDSKFAQSANYWKNSIGMNKCIDSIGIINQKQQFEARLRAWQDSTGYLKGKLDFDLMKRLYDARINTRKVFTNFTETFYRTNEFSTRALQLNKMQVEGPENNPKKQYICFEDNSNTWDAALDKEVQATLLKNYREHVPAEYLPKFYSVIDNKFGGDYKKYVDYLWKQSLLMKSGKKIYVNQKSYMKDPGVQYGLDLTEIIGSLYAELAKDGDVIATQERYLCDAKVRMEEDMPHYSDANFTMRLSYGQVGGFTIGNEKTNYYTEASSMVAKMKQGDAGVFDYKAEPIMQELLGAKDFGKYHDKTTNKMQLCFLTNNDITGGNSGSPMFDGKGQLIGLAFDGNWDSLSSDINFDSRLARCIGVDIRYVLYMMDKWGHADRLLKEINAK